VKESFHLSSRKACLNVVYEEHCEMEDASMGCIFIFLSILEPGPRSPGAYALHISFQWKHHWKLSYTLVFLFSTNAGNDQTPSICFAMFSFLPSLISRSCVRRRRKSFNHILPTTYRHYGYLLKISELVHWYWKV